MKKYGKENFKWISFECPVDDLDYNERLLIKELKTLTPNGYNLESGGHKNKNLAKETKDKISKTKIKRGVNKGEKNPMFGIRKFGKDNPNYGNHKLAGLNHPFYGEKHKLKSIQKMKIIKIGEKNPMFGTHRYKEKAPFYGKKHKSTSIKLMSEKRKKYWKTYIKKGRKEC